MPPPTTPDELFALLGKSGLVEPEPLAAARAAAAAGTPEEAADALVRQGLLTHFQADQLLAGKWRGFTLGKYRVLELLGAGGMGRVYLCQHTLLRRLVAIKILPAAAGKDPHVVERFYREARAAAALDHPNIVHAYDIDHDRGLHYLILELVDGVNLYDLVTAGRPLPPDRACHYIAQAAAGLQHAFEAGWVHRDIKPSNLLVDRAGVVKILDMGLARLFREEGKSLTQELDEKNVLGTADYLAPEQTLDSHNVDIRTDLYSLGGTLYFLLTGSPPFGEGSAAQKLLWHQLRDPPLLRERRPDLPAELEAVVHRMLSKDRARRYPTPASVAEALRPWTAEPVGPPAADELPRHSPLVRRLLQAGGPAAAVPLQELLRATPSPDLREALRATPPPPTRPAPAPATAPPGRRGRWGLLGAALVLLLAAAVAGWLVLEALRGPPAPPGPRQIAPAEAARHVNERVVVEFTVRGTGVSRNGKTVFLNSEPDFTHPRNFTIVSHDLEGFRKRGIEDPLSYFLGKTVRVVGQVTLYNGRPQIVVSDPAEVEVVKG
jgi:eukaryotic-like serine/threonine-protein kinase